MDWEGDESAFLADSSLKVTRKFVDPITFSYQVSVTHLPRVEDCDHETTVFNLVQPRGCGHKDVRGPKFYTIESTNASTAPSSITSLSPSPSSSPASSSAQLKSPLLRLNGSSKSVIAGVDNNENDIQKGSRQKDLVSPRNRLDTGFNHSKRKVVVLRRGSLRSSAYNDDKTIPPSSHESLSQDSSDRKLLEKFHDDMGHNRIPPASQRNLLLEISQKEKLDVHDNTNEFTPPPPSPVVTPVAHTPRSVRQPVQTQSPTGRLQERILRSPSNSPSSSNENKLINSLGAFLHRNAVDQFSSNVDSNGAIHKDAIVDDDRASIESRSMSTRSITDISFAERSKSEASLIRKIKIRCGRRNGGTSADDGTISSVASSTSHSRRSTASSAISSHSRIIPMNEDSVSVRQLIEESITHFSTQSPHLAIDTVSARSPRKVKVKNKSNKTILPKVHLGAFLDQNCSSGDDVHVDYNVREHRSTAAVSTMGTKSISTLSKAEQSGLEKKPRSGKTTDVMDDQEQVNDKVVQTDPKPIHSTILQSSCNKEISACVPVPTVYNVMNTSHYATTLDLSHDDDDQSIEMENVIPVDKKLRFKDGHSEREVPELTDSMYEELFYNSEELADFRYAAFMEVAGLDINEFL